MATKITLTIGERLAALKIFDSFKGNISELATILDDVKRLAINKEDWDKAGRKIIRSKDAEGKDAESWQWNEEDKATYKEVELGSESVSYLLKSIKERSDKGEITLTDGALISLQKKLK